jgi:hypothetical protein
MSNSGRIDAIGLSSSRNRMIDSSTKSLVAPPVRANSVLKSTLGTSRYDKVKSSTKLGAGLQTIDFRSKPLPKGSMTKSFVMMGNSPHQKTVVSEYNLNSSRPSYGPLKLAA